MIFMDYSTVVMTAAMCSAIYFAYKANIYKSELEQQNAKLLQVYLDKKFISKLISSVVEANVAAKDILSDLVYEIKEYFHFTDIIIYSDGEISYDPAPGVYIKNIVTKYLKDHEGDIKSKIERGDCVINSIYDEGLKYSLYISCLSCTDRKRTVVFVHTNDFQLSRYDIDTVSTSVSGILAAAFNLRYRLHLG